MSPGQNLETTEGFTQTAACIGNQYSDDAALKKLLAAYLPPDVLQKLEPEFLQVGEDAAGKLLRWSARAESSEPVLVPFDPWGQRIDQIQMSNSWKKLESYSATHGIVASGYERKYGEWSRVQQMVLLYLFHPSSAFVSCPLAMTDGAAKLIETYGDTALKNTAFKHLTSRDPKEFWTSGQWMTEKIGGSDVGLTETVARPMASSGGSHAGSTHELHGIKFFTSATTSPMAMTLARIEGAENGSRGLSLFYLNTGLTDGRLGPSFANGRLNKIEILRLKDKLGTRAMPTAELKLNGTPASLIGGAGDGVKKIATLFNVTRIYNSVCSVAQMRRAMAFAYDYSQKRVAFGGKIIDHALFRESFADAVVELEGCLHLIFRVAHLFGRYETGVATANESALLRLLTPIAKLYTGKSSVIVVSEMVEAFGGVGYCEDSGMPKMLRDAQVFPIWEGTTNVLSLDVLRALKKDCPFDVLLSEMRASLKDMPASVSAMIDELSQFEKALAGGSGNSGAGAGGALDADLSSASSREFAFAIARTYIAVLLAVSASKENSPRATARWQRWVQCSRKYRVATSAQREQSRLVSEL